jgi:hemin uptake protein HemP
VTEKTEPGAPVTGHWNPSKMSDAARTVRESAAKTRAIAVDGHQIDSRDLFIDGREIIIVHGNERYRLRLTKQNKMILTK